MRRWISNPWFWLLALIAVAMVAVAISVVRFERLWASAYALAVEETARSSPPRSSTQPLDYLEAYESEPEDYLD